MNDESPAGSPRRFLAPSNIKPRRRLSMSMSSKSSKRTGGSQDEDEDFGQSITPGGNPSAIAYPFIYSSHYSYNAIGEKPDDGSTSESRIVAQAQNSIGFATCVAGAQCVGAITVALAGTGATTGNSNNRDDTIEVGASGLVQDAYVRTNGDQETTKRTPGFKFWCSKTETPPIFDASKSSCTCTGDGDCSVTDDEVTSSTPTAVAPATGGVFAGGSTIEIIPDVVTDACTEGFVLHLVIYCD